MRQAIARDGLARNALRITLSSLQAAKARIHRQREMRSRWGPIAPGSNAGESRKADSGPDAVRLTVLAIDLLGPAALRACFSGREIVVRVPDDQTAKVFREALAQTARIRVTDRLVRIEVKAAPPQAAAVDHR